MKSLPCLLILSALPATPQGVRPPDANASSLRFSLGGKVVMDDARPLPDRVAVVLVCNGARVGVVYVNSSGQFAFPEMAASQPDCQVFANKQGYRSEIVSAAAALAAGNPNIGLVHLSVAPATEGVTTSRTSLDAPKDAVKAFDKAMLAVKKGKPEDAITDFGQAITAFPGYADAWYHLGRAHLASKAADGAIAAITAFTKSMAIDPLLVGPQVELGILAGLKKDWAASAQYLDRALELDPVDYPVAWFPDAVANMNLKKFDAAEKAAREALRLDPQHANPKIEYVLGLILAEKPDWPGAAAALKDYLKHAPNAPDAERVKGMIASLESPAAK